MHALTYGAGWGGWLPRPLAGGGARSSRRRLQRARQPRAAAGDALSGKGSYFQRVQVRPVQSKQASNTRWGRQSAWGRRPDSIARRNRAAQGWQGPLKAAMTSGSLSAAGDLLAQFLTGQAAKVRPSRRRHTPRTTAEHMRSSSPSCKRACRDCAPPPLTQCGVCRALVVRHRLTTLLERRACLALDFAGMAHTSTTGTTSWTS
jgi:hypothetical protein